MIFEEDVGTKADSARLQLLLRLVLGPFDLSSKLSNRLKGGKRYLFWCFQDI